MNDLPTKADELFCFSVYSAAHVINRAYTPLLKPLGLTYPQYITLTLLWEQDGQSVGQLAGRLKMESSTLTPLLKRIEKLGVVSRKRGTDDERQVFVHLSDKGRALQEHAPRITECLISATGLEMTQLQDLVATLAELTENLAADSA